MQGKVSELDNDFLVIYYHKHQELSDVKIQSRNRDQNVDSKYDSKDLFLDGYDYSLWSQNEN